MKTKTYSIAAAILAATTLPCNAGQKACKAPMTVESDDIWGHPITAPYWNEDSFITTAIRPVCAHHSFPGIIFGAGYANV